MSYAQDTSISIDRQIKFSFNITKEEYETMLSFSEDDKVRFLYIITHHNEDGSFNLGYAGKKTASSLREAISYYGSSTDSIFLRKTIKSNRLQYKFIVVGYCKNKNELEYGETHFIRYMKDFFKDKWVNKALSHGTFSTEGLISICKENASKFVRKEELDTYLNDGWYVGGNSKGLIAIYKGNHNKFVKEEELEKYIEDGWERGSNLKYLITLKKDNVFIRVRQEELKFYMDDGWLRIGASKGLIGINKNNEVKYVPEDELESYFLDGWVKGGRKGSIFMFKGDKNIRVSISEVSKYEEDGWERGNTNRGLIRIVKDNIEKRVKKEVLGEYLSNEWKVLKKEIITKHQEKRVRAKVVKEKVVKEKVVKEKVVREKVVKEKKKYVPYERTEDHKERMSLRIKKSVADGIKVSWNKGKNLTEEDKLKKKIAANRPEVREKRKLLFSGRIWFNNGKEEIWVKEEEFNALPNKEIWVNGRIPLSKEEKENKSRQNKYICPYCFKYVSSGNHVGDHIAKEHPLELQWKDLDKKEKEVKYRAINHLELDVVKTYFEELEKSRKIRYKEKPLNTEKEETQEVMERKREYCKKRGMESLF